MPVAAARAITEDFRRGLLDYLPVLADAKIRLAADREKGTAPHRHGPADDAHAEYAPAEHAH